MSWVVGWSGAREREHARRADRLHYAARVAPLQLAPRALLLLQRYYYYSIITPALTMTESPTRSYVKDLMLNR